MRGRLAIQITRMLGDVWLRAEAVENVAIWLKTLIKISEGMFVSDGGAIAMLKSRSLQICDLSANGRWRTGFRLLLRDAEVVCVLHVQR